MAWLKAPCAGASSVASAVSAGTRDWKKIAVGLAAWRAATPTSITAKSAVSGVATACLPIGGKLRFTASRPCCDSIQRNPSGKVLNVR